MSVAARRGPRSNETFPEERGRPSENGCCGGAHKWDVKRALADWKHLQLSQSRPLSLISLRVAIWWFVCHIRYVYV